MPERWPCSRPQIVSLDLRGAMQEASGAVAPPFPNLAEFTPSAMMGDCIHPNYAGYSAVLERSWPAYWGRFFPGTRTSATARNATAAAAGATPAAAAVEALGSASRGSKGGV